MRLKACIFILQTVAIFTAPALTAQTYSYDGNRWYEIEVTVFSNELAATDNELLIPDKTTLAYPQSIRQLSSASSSFMIDFDDISIESQSDEIRLPSVLIGVQEDIKELPVQIGPKFYAGESEFRITDFNSDPYIALGEEAASFLEYNMDIDRSPEHRVLFHAVWRQPVLNRVQATAIYVTGGEVYGEHHELEGSLRFSYDVNRVDVEANLWLSQFTRSFNNQAANNPAAGNQIASLELPEPPFENKAEDTFSAGPDGVFSLVHLAYMQQERAMISNELHYLDHPELGILVEIRPYQLPEPGDFFD